MDRAKAQEELTENIAKVLNELFKTLHENYGIRRIIDDEPFSAGLCDVCNPFNEKLDDIMGIIIDGFHDDASIWVMPYITKRNKKIYIISVWTPRVFRKDCGKPYRTYKCRNISQVIKAVAYETMKSISKNVSCNEYITEYIYDAKHPRPKSEPNEIIEAKNLLKDNGYQVSKKEK